MSFETLLWLGLTLLFVLAPAFGNRRKQGQDGQPPAPPRQPGQPGQAAGSAGQQEKPQPGSFESRLEEARRRIEAAVREQEQQGRGSRPTSGSQPVAAAPQPQSTGIDWQAAPRKHASTAGAAILASRRASEERARRMKESSSGLQVTTPQRSRTYTGRREAVDAHGMFNRKALLSGYIWHQILSEPPHKSGTRRRVSRLRSP